MQNYRALCCLLLVFATFFIGVASPNLGAADIVKKDPNVVDRVVTSSLGRVEDFRSDMHVWDKSVRGFRRDHNFVFSSGISRGTWRFRQFGNVQSERVRTRATYSKFQYSFHLPIKAGVGYFLGTSFGVGLSETASIDGFHRLLRVSLPGGLVGIAWNVSPAIRLSSGLDLFLERLEGVGVDGKEEQNQSISISARSAAGHIALDLFVRLAWALRLEASLGKFRTEKPHNAANYGTNVRIEKQETSVGLGLAYHFL